MRRHPLTHPVPLAAVAALLTACGDAPTGVPAEMSPGVDLTELADPAEVGASVGNVAHMAHGRRDDHVGLRTGRRTARELQAARRASARYQRLEDAIADGYADIDVFLPGMGYHYLRADRLDADFEPSRPELLVYWPDRHGRLRLVAVEYAVPLALLPDHPPEGFTGSADVWDRNETFQLWTLHAWVWLDNPDGVFAPFNPRLQ